MISCYFILLTKMHKKQNGQLARPFIPQVLAVLFYRLESAILWARGWPYSQLLEVPSPYPHPLHPTILAFGSCCVSSACRRPLQAPPLFHS